MRYEYSSLFTNNTQVEKYERKFSAKIDILRHRIECQIIKQYAVGDLFDCSVGHGRFINKLTSVQTYTAMDYSEAFIHYIQNHYPQVSIKKGDLLERIEEPDNRYDTVLCIRTIAGLGEPAHIISQMARIAKPGGRIIFDYDWERDSSENDLSIANILQTNSMKIVKAVRVDSLFAMTIKHCSRLSKQFNRRINIIPIPLYTLLEKTWGTLSGERVIYIAAKDQKH